MTLIEAESRAVRELEEILKDHGWRDGWGMSAKDVAASNAPFFYRNGTSLEACLTRIRITGEAKILYLILQSQGADIAYSGDMPFIYAINVQLQFYTDDPAVYYAGSSFENPYARYLSAVLESLSLKFWTIEDGGEEAVASGDSSVEYLHRKTIYITKLI